MNDVPVQVIIAAFPAENGADDALKALKQAKWDGLIAIQNAAVLRRDAQSKLHIKETGDMGGGKGAVIGGVVGGVVGLLAGPIGWAALGGATIGGLAAKLRDSGFPDDRLKEIGAGLTPGTSAIIAVIEHTWVRDAERMLAQEGAKVVTQGLAKDIAAQLAENQEVAYTALAADGVMVAGRVVGDKDAAVADKGAAVGEAKTATDQASGGAAGAAATPSAQNVASQPSAASQQSPTTQQETKTNNP